MKYSVHRLDRRFSYHNWFEYYLGFPSSMTQSSGPMHFNHALQWFVETYGWSAEIRQYADIHRWANVPVAFSTKFSMPRRELPDVCNPHWSWTNGVGEDLRIYVKSDRELAFFQLAHKVDQ